jgi:hypothetical protein
LAGFGLFLAFLVKGLQQILPRIRGGCRSAKAQEENTGEKGVPDRVSH